MIIIIMEFISITRLGFVLLYVPCLFRTQVTMALDNCLSFAALNQFQSTNYLHKFIRQVMHYFHLFLLLSIYLVSVKFSKPSFLIVCLRNFSGHFMLLSISVLFLFPFSLKLGCCLCVLFMVFSVSFCRTTFQVSSSSVMISCSIHCYMGGLILQNSSVLFSLFPMRFSCQCQDSGEKGKNKGSTGNKFIP